MGFTCHLSSRALLRVSGAAPHEFLQGLFTNDLRTLRPGGSLWGCFLHNTGRVLCDAYLYQSGRAAEGQAAILIDVHSSVAEGLQEHLKEYRLRRKVKIEDVSSELTVVAAAASSETLPATGSAGTHVPQAEDKKADPPLKEPLPGDSHETFTDPRSFALPATLRKIVLPTERAPSFATDPEAHYSTFLYTAGVGEGPEVFRPSKTLPFEANTDFLRGVSFHKGCYMGQELTHRAHVMLVTRKRTVPLHFGRQQLQHPEHGTTDIGSGSNRDINEEAPQRGALGTGDPPARGSSLLVAEKQVGEVLTVCGNVGLGLLRLSCADITTRSFPGLSLRDGTPVVGSIPKWWEEKELRKAAPKS